MRSLMVSAIAVFALWVLSADSAQQKQREDKRGILETISDRNVQRSLPSGTVIGGNLIWGGEWYVLSASEVSAVRTLLKKEERHVDTGMPPPNVPLALIKVVLWGIADGNVVPLDVILVDRSFSILMPLDGKAGYYGVRDGKERECLQKLMKRIHEGKELPVVQAQAGGSLPKSAD
jgi:hypothetical protein